MGTPAGRWREQIHWIPLHQPGGDALLFARICRPQGATPAPVAVINHGAPPPGIGPTMMQPASCDTAAAQWFLSHGFLVVFAMRRGYGATGGTEVENSGLCVDPDYDRAGLVGAEDIAATVSYATSLPYARPDGAVVVGQSSGGWATVAYDGVPHPRVAALISMAGGRGGWAGGVPRRNCRPDRLVQAAGRFGAVATTPMLWIYAANDSYFPPDLAAAMHAAFVRAGGRAELAQVGPYDGEGHRLFSGPGGPAIWGPIVARYLAERESVRRVSSAP
ncbi:MAG: hypothetical protein JO264_19795 [Acidisphaera sp.]|nr:hypothetical protein [Acidisphaera sp.]